MFVGIASLRFDKGLKPQIRDRVYLTTDANGVAVATTKYPNEGTVKNVLFNIGLLRRRPVLHVGFVADASRYTIDQTCEVEFA